MLFCAAAVAACPLRHAVKVPTVGGTAPEAVDTGCIDGSLG
jgi:hypothetical protein